ncbi:MAG: DMT family transporter [Pseudomonadota bacterium]
MTGLVFAVVLFAAFLHALWNSLLKSGSDKKTAMASVVLGHVPFGLIAFALSPTPSAESWPYVLVGAAIHFLYQMLLMNAYRFGDLTQVYPVSRGIAPLIVALVSVLVLGVSLSLFEGIAIALIAIGITSFALVGYGSNAPNAKAFWLAVATGCMIAGYSLVDGLGARLAGTALGFFAWLTMLNGSFMALYLILNRGQKTPKEALKIDPWMALIGGGSSFAAYALVIWSFTQAPIAAVTALRETSIVFALLIGVTVLGERFSLQKLLATFLTLSGAALLRLSK